MVELNICRKEMEWGGRKLVLETGKIAKQALGAVEVTYGGTAVLATVCAAKEAAPDQDFFPLTVNYQEKYYATGKIPGGFMKREGKPSEREVLISRLIDRPIRPLFPDAFKNEVQVICTVLSHDQQTDSDVVAMLAASAALAVSGIPFLGPIGAAKIGYKDGEYILNPTTEQQKESQLELAVAGTTDGVLMVESEAQELSEEVMLGAVMFGFENFQPVIKLINEMVEEAGKPRWEAPKFPPEFDELYAKLEKGFIAKFEEGLDYKIGINGNKLSGGQRQRLALARTLLTNRPIVIMDEPTTGLDQVLSFQVMKSLKELAKHKTVLLVTHNPTEIALADRVLIIKDKHVVADGEPLHLVTHSEFLKSAMTKQDVLSKRELFVAHCLKVA